MEILEGNRIECSKCEEVIDLEDAVGLNKKTRSMFKPLCGDCLESVGVPAGWELERDITYFARDK
ncbi:MAG: hypothetical protein ACOC0Z_04350 [Halohasta sp.]